VRGTTYGVVGLPGGVRVKAERRGRWYYIRGQNSGYGIGVVEGQTRPRSQGEVGWPAEEEVRVSGNVATSSLDGGRGGNFERAPLWPAARKSPTCEIVWSTLYYLLLLYTHILLTMTPLGPTLHVGRSDFFPLSSTLPFATAFIRSSSNRRRCMCSYLRRPPYNNIILLYTQLPMYSILYNYII